MTFRSSLEEMLYIIVLLIMLLNCVSGAKSLNDGAYQDKRKLLNYWIFSHDL